MEEGLPSHSGLDPVLEVELLDEVLELHDLVEPAEGDEGGLRVLQIQVKVIASREVWSGGDAIDREGLDDLSESLVEAGLDLAEM